MRKLEERIEDLNAKTPSLPVGKNKEWLRTSDGWAWLGTSDGWAWLRTSDGWEWLKSIPEKKAHDILTSIGIAE